MVRILHTAGWLSQEATLVVDIGVHLSEAYLPSAVDALVAEVHRIPLADRPRLLWRETAPQHFPTPTGQHAGQEQQSNSSWQSGFEEFNSPYRCTTQRATDIYNRLSNPILRLANVSILPIWGPTNQRWMEHFSMDHTVNDCTHYRLPSAAMELWSGFLIEQIC